MKMSYCVRRLIYWPAQGCGSIGRMSEAMRRSLLYVPASERAMAEKAGARGADVIILDLEDGVAPTLKDSARASVPSFLREVDFGGTEILVRTNSPSSGWGGSDLEMVAEARPAGVVLPKVEDPAEVAAVDGHLGSSTPLFLISSKRGFPISMERS